MTYLFYQVTMRDVSNRRKFFEDFAKTNNIDPHNPRHWANIPADKILAIKVNNFGVFVIILLLKNLII